MVLRNDSKRITALEGRVDNLPTKQQTEGEFKAVHGRLDSVDERFTAMLGLL